MVKAVRSDDPDVNNEENKRKDVYIIRGSLPVDLRGVKLHVINPVIIRIF